MEKKKNLEFKLKHKVVEVGIIGHGDGVFSFDYTNYGTNEEGAEAIDYFNQFFNFQNWKMR